MYETDQTTYKQGNFVHMSKEEARSSKFLSKVYGYMFIAILITSVVAGVIGALCSYALDTEDALISQTIVIAIIASSIGILVCSVIISVFSIRMKHSIAIPGILYSIFMGVLIGLIVFPFNYAGQWWIVASAFGITAMTFGIMYIIGAKAKRNISWIGLLGYGLLFGALILSLAFSLIYLFARAYFSWLYVAIDGIIFIAFLLITMYDVYMIQRIANNGENNSNIALYCAFRLYADFIYIFIRILAVLSKIFNKK